MLLAGGDVFKQDLAPCHSAKKVKQFHKSKESLLLIGLRTHPTRNAVKIRGELSKHGEWVAIAPNQAHGTIVAIRFRNEILLKTAKNL